MLIVRTCHSDLWLNDITTIYGNRVQFGLLWSMLFQFNNATSPCVSIILCAPVSTRQYVMHGYKEKDECRPTDIQLLVKTTHWKLYIQLSAADSTKRDAFVYVIVRHIQHIQHTRGLHPLQCLVIHSSTHISFVNQCVSFVMYSMYLTTPNIICTIFPSLPNLPYRDSLIRQYLLLPDALIFSKYSSISLSPG